MSGKTGQPVCARCGDYYRANHVCFASPGDEYVCVDQTGKPKGGRCGKCRACKHDGIDELVGLIEEVIVEKANTPKDLNEMTDEEVRDMFDDMEGFFDEDEPSKEIAIKREQANTQAMMAGMVDEFNRVRNARRATGYEPQGRARMDEAEALKVLAGMGQVSPSRGLHRGDGPDVGVKVRGTREICIGNTFTLWGVRLSPGDVLDDTQVSQLQMISRNPITDNAIRKVIKAILDAAPSTSMPALAPVEEPAIPQELADEMTVRAREALIATGEFPGMEEQVRAGYMDSLSGIRSSIRAMRDMGLPVPALQSRVPAVKHLEGIVIPRRPSMWARFGDWMESFQHRFVRLWTRYESAKARNLELAAQIVSERRDWKSQFDVKLKLLGEHADTIHELKVELGKARALKLEAKGKSETEINRLQKQIRLLTDNQEKLKSELNKAAADAAVLNQLKKTVPVDSRGALLTHELRVCKAPGGSKRWVSSDGKSFGSEAEAKAYIKGAWLPTGGSGVKTNTGGPTFIGNDTGASSVGQSSLAAFLNKSSDEEEREALLELAKQALVQKVLDPNTDTYRLVMTIPNDSRPIYKGDKAGRPKRPPPPGPSKHLR